MARQYFKSTGGGTSTTSTGSWSDGYTLTFTPKTNTSYLIIANWSTYCDGDGFDFEEMAESQLVQTDPSSVTVDYFMNPTAQSDSSGTGELFSVPCTTMTKVTFGASVVSQTYKIQVKSRLGAEVGVFDGFIYAIELNSNDDYIEDLTGSSHGSISYTSALSYSFTPPVSGNYLVLATTSSSTFRVGSISTFGTIKGVSGADDKGVNTVACAVSGDERWPYFTSWVDNYTSSTSVKLQAKTNTTARPIYLYKSRMAFLHIGNGDISKFGELIAEQTTTSTSFNGTDKYQISGTESLGNNPAYLSVATAIAGHSADEGITGVQVSDNGYGFPQFVSPWAYQVDIPVGQVFINDGTIDTDGDNFQWRAYASGTASIKDISVATIWLSEIDDKDVSVMAFIGGTSQENQHVKANITNENVTKNNSSTANIAYYNQTFDQDSLANILVITNRSNSVSANIKGIKSNVTKASIVQKNISNSENSLANILVETTQANLVFGNIKAILNLYSKANIFITQSTNLYSKSNILVTESKNNAAVGSIIINLKKAQNTVGNIINTYNSSNSSTSNILVENNTANNTSLANFLVETTYSNVVTANIPGTVGSEVGSNIIGYLSQDSSVIANIGGEDFPSRVSANVRKKIFNKYFEYRVYDDNQFVTSWGDAEILSEPSFRTVINGGPGEMIIKLARSFDDFGEDIDVKLANRVDCYVFDREAPSGQVLYSGFISGYRPVLDEHTEFIEVTLLPYVSELAFIMYRDGSGNTEIDQASQDPSDIVRDVIDRYRADGGYLNYDSSTIEDTGATVSYTYNLYTCKEAIDKTIELTPDNWYWRIDSDNKVYLKEADLNTPDHQFQIGKHIQRMETWRRSEDIINRVYFVGQESGGVPMYRVYSNASSINAYGLHTTKYVDQRVSLTATADLIANRIINKKKDPEIRTTLTIIDNNGKNSGKGYDIESIKVGETMKIKNIKQGVKTISLWDQAEWDVDVWDQTLSYSAADTIQILSVEYHPNYVVVEASSRLPEIPKRIEDISRNSTNQATWNAPTAPTEA